MIRDVRRRFFQKEKIRSDVPDQIQEHQTRALREVFSSQTRLSLQAASKQPSRKSRHSLKKIQSCNQREWMLLASPQMRQIQNSKN